MRRVARDTKARPTFARGYTNRQIPQALSIPPGPSAATSRIAYTNLGVHSRTDAVAALRRARRPD